MEHEYEIPKVQEIEVYYDLVTAFVSVLESVTIYLSNHADVNFVINDGNGFQGKFRRACEKKSVK